MKRKVIAVAATKGGVSKTTLAACLAVEAAGAGRRVGMVDVDPQRTLTRWWERRADLELDEKGLRLFEDVRSAAAWADVTFVDTPPGDIQRIAPIIRSADLVLVPVKASILDIEAVEPILDLCAKNKKAVAFVLTQVHSGRAINASAIEALRMDGDVLEATLPERASFVSAMTVGRTGPESSDRKQAKAAAEDITAIWAEVEGYLS